MLTAKHGEFDEAEALDSGADDYLTKPFSFVVLVARIRALLRRGGRATPVTHTAGDLRLDPATHRCFRGDVEITLTAREFAVLEFLMRRVGEVVSKAEILDNVWDFAFDGDPNIVEVYVRHLRKKIDEPFGRHSIETVRGAGLPARRRTTADRCAASPASGSGSRSPRCSSSASRWRSAGSRSSGCSSARSPHDLESTARTRARRHRRSP